MSDASKFHPVTRVICGAFSVLAAGVTIIMPLSTLAFDTERAAVFLLCASLALLTGYFSCAGEIPRSWPWAVVAAPVVLMFLLIPILGAGLLIQELASGSIEPSWWWFVVVLFFLRPSRTAPAQPSDAADGEPRPR